MTIKFRIEQITAEKKDQLESLGGRYVTVSNTYPFRDGWDTIEYNGSSDTLFSTAYDWCITTFKSLDIKVLEAWHILKVRIA